MRYFLFLVLIASSHQVFSQKEFSWEKIRPETKLIVDKITDFGVIPARVREFDGFLSPQYENMLNLRYSSTWEELLLLVNCPIPIVRCISFQALCEEHPVNLLQLVIDHIDDQDMVRVQSADVIMTRLVGDVFIDIAANGAFSTQKKTILDSAQVNMLDSVLVFRKNQLNATDQALLRINSKPHFYERIRKLAAKGKHPSSLVALAKYHNVSDLKFFYGQMSRTRRDQSSIKYIFKAIEEFPHPHLYEYVKDYLDESIWEDESKVYWREMTAAILAYDPKNSEEELIRYLEENSSHVNSSFLANAIVVNLTKKDYSGYEKLKWMLWERQSYTSVKIVEELASRDMDRAIEQAKISLMGINAFHVRNRSSHIQAEYIGIPLIDKLFRLVLAADPGYAHEIIRSNFKFAYTELFELYYNYALQDLQPMYVSTLLNRIEKEIDLEIVIMAVHLLAKYESNETNNAIKEAVNNNPNTKTGLRAKELHEIMKGYNLE